MSSSIYSVVTQTNKGTASEFPHDQIQQHWQPNIFSANTQPFPKVGSYDMSEDVDSCDLFLCQPSVSFPRQEIGVKTQKHTQTINGVIEEVIEE